MVDDRVPAPLVLIGGFLGGAALGVVARIWMRFISTDPGFTWSGTLFIVVGFGVAGLAQSGAYLGRRARLGRRRMTIVRIITFVGLLPLGMAAGGQVFPTVVLAPLAIGHTEWSRRSRALLGLVALVPVVLVGASLNRDLSVLRAIVGFVWFLAIYAVIVWGAGFTLAPQRDGWRLPPRVRVAAAVALALIAIAIGWFLVGAS